MVTHRYYGPFRTLLLAGKLTSKHLAEALRSDTPYNPFPHGQVPVELISASDYFADVVNEPEVIAGWKNTQAALALLQDEVRATEKIERDAQRATELILNPIRMRQLEAFAGNPAWTVLPDGTLRVAYVRNESPTKVNTLVVETPAGDSQFTAILPDGFPSWVLTWYHHTDGSVWLYALGCPAWDSGKPNVPFRMKWGFDQEFHKIDLPKLDEGDKPVLIGNAGPGFMLLSVNSRRPKSYNLATAIPKILEAKTFYGAQTAAIDQAGNLQLQRFQKFERDKGAVLTAANGKVIEVIAGKGTLMTIEGADSPNVHAHLQKSEHDTEQIMIYEAPNKEIYIGMIQILDDEKKLFSVFRPSISDQAYYSFEFPTQTRERSHHELHFFQGPRQEVYAGFGYKGLLSIHDVTNKSEVLNHSLDAFVIGWFDHKGQTYFWTNSDRTGTPLYKLFGKSGRSP